MRMRALALLLLAFAVSGSAEAVCTGGFSGTVLLHGTLLDCRSALPELEAVLEKDRDSYENMAAFYRTTVLSHMENLTKPYDEHVAFHLSRVQGVIVTFAVDSRALIPADAKETPPATWEDYSERREIFLQLGGSSCDLLPDPLPTVLLQESICCDTPTRDSCKLGLMAALLPEAKHLEQIR
jgi:hypothetical protein